jgi:hypothetical protein
MTNESGCPNADKAMLVRSLEGCTDEEARRLIWSVVEAAGLDPREVLGLDVDDDDCDPTVGAT